MGNDPDMATPPPIPAAPPPAAPPTTPGHLGTKRRQTTWPRVVGILLIIVGALSVISSAFQLFSAIVNGAIGASMQGGGEIEAVYEVHHRYAWLLSMVYALNLVAATCPLIGGILLLKHRKMAWALLVHWSWAKILLACLTSFATFLFTRDVVNSVGALSGQPGVPPSLSETMALIQAAFVLLIGMVVPILVLCFFLPRKTRHQMQGWER